MSCAVHLRLYLPHSEARWYSCWYMKCFTLKGFPVSVYRTDLTLSLTVSWGEVSHDKWEHQSASSLVVHRSDAHPYHHWHLANETPEKLLWGQETGVVFVSGASGKNRATPTRETWLTRAGGRPLRHINQPVLTPALGATTFPHVTSFLPVNVLASQIWITTF